MLCLHVFILLITKQFQWKEGQGTTRKKVERAWQSNCLCTVALTSIIFLVLILDPPFEKRHLDYFPERIKEGRNRKRNESSIVYSSKEVSRKSKNVPRCRRIRPLPNSFRSLTFPLLISNSTKDSDLQRSLVFIANGDFNS